VEHPGGVVHVLLSCHDSGCTAVFEAYGRLDDVETLECDCGRALQIVRYLSDPGQGSDRVSLIRLAA
jgi:hypothetical protein